MTQITAEMVRDLRERTGVGMMDCKKALVAANGEIDIAIETLRKAGQASAVKKGNRIAAEGVVSVASTADNKTAVIVEVNCETDFVAREARFKSFAQQAVNCALVAGVKNSESLVQTQLDSGKTIEETRLELVSQLGENLAVRRIYAVHAEANGITAAYVHGGEAGTARIGAVVALSINDAALAKNLTMHIAAMKPEYISETEVPAERIAKEKEILLAQAQEANAGKPLEILEKIIDGKMGKFLKEITLLGQPFIMDPDQTVGALLNSAKAKVTDFVRFEVGEGIEKKVTDFVGEVMSQVKG